MRVALLVLLLAACKERGTHVVSLAGSCTAGTMQLVVVEGGRCGACVCGECLAQCDDPAAEVCSFPCGSGDCGAGEVTFDPPGDRDVAVIAQILAPDDAGVVHVVGLGCAEIDIDPDGTESRTYQIDVQCCGGTP